MIIAKKLCFIYLFVDLWSQSNCNGFIQQYDRDCNGQSGGIRCFGRGMVSCLLEKHVFEPRHEKTHGETERMAAPFVTLGYVNNYEKIATYKKNCEAPVFGLIWIILVCVSTTQLKHAKLQL